MSCFFDVFRQFFLRNNVMIKWSKCIILYLVTGIRKKDIVRE